jgi:hypothetical protein
MLSTVSTLLKTELLARNLRQGCFCPEKKAKLFSKNAIKLPKIENKSKCLINFNATAEQ